jgi:hypothetical protein
MLVFYGFIDVTRGRTSAKALHGVVQKRPVCSVQHHHKAKWVIRLLFVVQALHIVMASSQADVKAEHQLILRAITSTLVTGVAILYDYDAANEKQRPNKATTRSISAEYEYASLSQD